jgi:hypothetical protein
MKINTGIHQMKVGGKMYRLTKTHISEFFDVVLDEGSILIEIEPVYTDKNYVLNFPDGRLDTGYYGQAWIDAHKDILEPYTHSMDAIEQEAERYASSITKNDTYKQHLYSAVLHGHSLAQQEIERLKGLVELAYQEGTKRHLFPDEHHFWPQFKQQHNL